MEITVTWHLVLLIILTITFIVRIFKESESDLDFTPTLNIIVLVIVWAIYGGIFIW